MSFDAASFAIGRQSGGGGVTIEPLPVTANGTYTAEEGTAYTPVTVNVPNSYAAGDEGKAVRNGALAAQTAATKTGVGTYDTTYNNSVTFQLGALTNGAAAADIASGKTAYGADGRPITGTASGGGNPNYVETITGTLGNPWGNIDLQSLYDELVAGDASATITFLRGTTERTRMTLFFEPDTDVAAGDNAFYTEGVYLTASNMNVYSLYWYAGELEEANYTSGASAKAIDFSDNAEMLAKVTTLTIVHHPLTGTLQAAEDATFGGN